MAVERLQVPPTREDSSLASPRPTQSPVRIPVERVAGVLNADPEFVLAARGWDMRLALRVGERGYLLVVRGGEVVEVVEGIDKLTYWFAELRGTEEDWTALLSATPPAFYQDFFGAVFRRGFQLNGDLERLFAHYPAVTRMLSLLRQLCADQAVAA